MVKKSKALAVKAKGKIGQKVADAGTLISITLSSALLSKLNALTLKRSEEDGKVYHRNDVIRKILEDKVK